jgi:hypothetical protein
MRVGRPRNRPFDFIVVDVNTVIVSSDGVQVG